MEMSPYNSLMAICGGEVVATTARNTTAVDDVAAAVGVAAADDVVVVVGAAAAVAVWVQRCVDAWKFAGKNSKGFSPVNVPN